MCACSDDVQWIKLENMLVINAFINNSSGYANIFPTVGYLFKTIVARVVFLHEVLCGSHKIYVSFPLHFINLLYIIKLLCT